MIMGFIPMPQKPTLKKRKNIYNTYYMTKEEIITHVGNDIVASLNLPQIISITQEHAVQRAMAYYESLDEEEKKNLELKITEAQEAIKQAQEESKKEAVLEN